MYSLMLMLAINSGVDAPECHRHRGGCYGGYGCGGSYGGGGGCYGRGGWGGCYGGGYGGGWGGCYGGGGGYWAGGQSYGGVVIGGYNNSSPYYAGPMYSWPTNGNNTAGYGYGSMTQGDAGYYQGLQATGPNGEAPARIVVTLPENAKLSIGDAETQQNSTMRMFDSPALEPGKTYHYKLTAKIEQDGRTISKSKDVEVQAGKVVQVSFNDELRKDRKEGDADRASDQEKQEKDKR